MKTMIPTLTALAALCAGTTSPANAQPPATAEAQIVQATVGQAQQQAARVAEERIRAQWAVELAQAQLPVEVARAGRVVQLAQATAALAPAGEQREPAEAADTIPSLPRIPPGGGAYPATMSGSGIGGGMGGAVGGLFAPPRPNVGQSLIIRTSDSNASTLGEIHEDMTVMSRILTRALSDGRGDDAQGLAMGIVVSALGGDQRPQSLYLDGYGALFLLNVRMPLLPPPPTKETEKKETPVDTTWEQTKRELYGAGPAPGGGAEWPGWRAYQNSFGEMQRRYGVLAAGAQPVEYDARKVELLKKQLLEALKNASNIRHLKSDEWVTVAVNGPGSDHAILVKQRFKAAAPRPSARSNADSLEGPEVADVAVVRGGPHQGAGRSSTLTMWVKKTDVDAFAKGKLTFDEFQRKASVAAY